MPITIAEIAGLLTNPEIISKLLKLLFPDMSDQVDSAIMDLRKQREEKRAKFKKAVADMDDTAINLLIDELLP